MNSQITLSDTKSQMMYQKNLATVGALTLSDAEKLLALTEKSDEMALVTVKETIEDSDKTICELKEQIAQLYATVGNLSNENAALKGQYKTLSLSQEATVAPMKEEIATLKKSNEDLKKQLAESNKKREEESVAASKSKETAVQDALKMEEQKTNALLESERQKANVRIAEEIKKADARVVEKKNKTAIDQQNLQYYFDSIFETAENIKTYAARTHDQSFQEYIRQHFAQICINNANEVKRYLNLAIEIIKK